MPGSQEALKSPLFWKPPLLELPSSVQLCLAPCEPHHGNYTSRPPQEPLRQAWNTSWSTGPVGRRGCFPGKSGYIQHWLEQQQSYRSQGHTCGLRGRETRAGDPWSRYEGPDLRVWDQEDGVVETEPGRPRDGMRFGRIVRNMAAISRGECVV